MDSIIDILKLDKGFDEERMNLENIDSEKIIKVSSILIGGYLFVSNLSPFIAQLLFIFKSDNIGTPIVNKEKFIFTEYIINLIMGYLLFTNYDTVANLLKSNKEN